MLVLGIKKGDTLVVGSAVLSFDKKGNKWRVGIAAPPEIKIRRGELEARNTPESPK